METYDSLHIKGIIAGEAFIRMGRYAFQLIEAGASLRLLSGLLCMRNYGSVYKRLIDKNVDMQRNNRRGVSRYEKRLLAEWEKANPMIAEAMRARGITPRKWCCAYGLVTDDNYADLSILTVPHVHEDNTDKPRGTIFSLLREDFPEAFGMKLASYQPAVVDPDLYYHYKKAYAGGNARHIFWVDSLNVKVINASDFLAYTTFKKRLLQEVRIQRMAQLIASGLSAENIKSALAWLPEDVSKSRLSRGGENPGEGHKMMRAAEKARQKELEQYSQRLLLNQHI